MFQCIQMQFSAVQCSSRKWSLVQFSAVQCSAVQFSSVQFSSVQFSSVPFSSDKVAENRRQGPRVSLTAFKPTVKSTGLPRKLLKLNWPQDKNLIITGRLCNTYLACIIKKISINFWLTKIILFQTTRINCCIA